MPRMGQVIKPKVKLGKDPEACWSWLGPVAPNGVSYKQIAGRNVPARRWLWEQLFGPIPDGMVIAQLCGKGDCINPFHLKCTTLADAQRLGTNPTLTAGDAKAILAARGTVSARKLANDYEVSPGAIRDIWRGDTWKRRTKSTKARSPTAHLEVATA